jgi:hypothetical protein|tara:strand:- start:1326 stop:2561 length:1236 start_codon:yes stop_codon:yes gene_type:complete
MKPIEIQNLDQHLKPLQVDGVSTGLELSTQGFRISSGELDIKNLTSETAKVDGDLTVDGNIQMVGESGTKINMYRGVSIEATSNDDFLQIDAKRILLDSASNYTDSGSGLFLQADDGFDAQISFMEGATTSWSIGNDGGEATSTLSFVTGAVLGTNEAMSLDANGDLTVFGDIVAGDDIAVAGTGKLSLDGIGGHTYIHEASADDLEIVVGGDTMATFDEANDRITIAATKHTSALANGTEFSATDSAYAGMILGYTRIANDSTTLGNNFTTINSSAMTVIQTDQGTNFSIQFIVPPSGNVEIQCSFWVTATTGGAKFSLSTGTSYAELDETHTYDADQTFYIDETDHYVQNINFAVTGLTAGTDTTYYLAGLASEASVHISHGRNRTTGTHAPPVIIRALALPATITTGE